MKLSDKEVRELILSNNDYGMMISGCLPTGCKKLRGVVVRSSESAIAVFDLADSLEELLQLRTMKQDIIKQGYGIMLESNGRYTIHDISEHAKIEEAKTTEVINENLKLEKFVVVIETLKNSTPDIPLRILLTRLLEQLQAERGEDEQNKTC